jgi:hypothetical protein
MTTSLTLRNTKGSPLTNAEVDSNFSSLRDNKVETSAIIDLAHGGTNASTLAQAQANLGIIEAAAAMAIALG